MNIFAKVEIMRIPNHRLLDRLQSTQRSKNWFQAVHYVQFCSSDFIQPAREAFRPEELRALGLLLADGAPTVGGGKTF